MHRLSPYKSVSEKKRTGIEAFEKSIKGSTYSTYTVRRKYIIHLAVNEKMGKFLKVFFFLSTLYAIMSLLSESMKTLLGIERKRG